jgi:hypothetical protein
MEKVNMSNQYEGFDCEFLQSSEENHLREEMKGDIKKKKIYAPPKIAVHHVRLEGSICVGSAKLNIDGTVQQSWNEDDTDNRDISWM